MGQCRIWGALQWHIELSGRGSRRRIRPAEAALPSKARKRLKKADWEAKSLLELPHAQGYAAFACHCRCCGGRSLQSLRDFRQSLFIFRHRFQKTHVVLVPCESNNSFLLGQMTAPLFRERLLTHQVTIATHVCEVSSGLSFNLRDRALEDCIAMLVNDAD